MRFVTVFAILLAVAVHSNGTGYSRYLSVNTDNEKRLAKAEELIKAFGTEREPERLREAGQELESVDLKRIHKREARHATRQRCFELWLTLLKTIDAEFDPTFDLEQSPPLKVSPPPLKDGTQLMPGASPDMIDDPKAREEYQKSIEANRELQEKLVLQTELKDLVDSIPSKVKAFIKNMFTDGDRESVSKTIEKFIEKHDRRAELNAVLDAKPEE